jgi:cation transport ATPase
MDNASKPQKRGRKPKKVIQEENVVVSQEDVVKKDVVEETNEETEKSLKELEEEPQLVEEKQEETENKEQEESENKEQEESENKEQEESENKEQEESENKEQEESENKEQEQSIILETIEEVMEDVKNSLDIKSLLNMLIIISFRKELQEKYNINAELAKILITIVQQHSEFIIKIEESFKTIVADNKIDSDDVPELMKLFSNIYSVVVSLKIQDFKNVSSVCGDLIKLTFNIMLSEKLIDFSGDSQENTVNIFNALVDSSVSLINLKSTIMNHYKSCCLFC